MLRCAREGKLPGGTSRAGLRARAPGLIYKPPESPLQSLKTSLSREGAARLQKEQNFSGFALQTNPPPPPPQLSPAPHRSLCAGRGPGGEETRLFLFNYLFIFPRSPSQLALGPMGPVYPSGTQRLIAGSRAEGGGRPLPWHSGLKTTSSDLTSRVLIVIKRL